MFLFFYNTIIFILSPLLFFVLFLRAFFKRKNFKFYLKRFYFGKSKYKGEMKKSVHFHGVSVGEILSLQNLISKIKEKNCEISISVGTSAGYETALRKYSSFSGKILPAPFELIFSVKNFLKKINPSIFIVAEAEFWFNLFYLLKKKDIPIWIVNFRLGNPKNYKRFSFYYKKVFSLIDLFFVPEKRYSDFLKEFGVESDRIVLTGNLKADFDFREIPDGEKENLIKSLKIAQGKKLFVCGSTTEGEEELLIKVFEKFRDKWQLIIAPRHIERAQSILNMIRKNSDLKVSLKTELKENYDVLILNTIGELFSVYSLADLAFVGGSLKPVGGHNVLEPVFHKKLTLTGPHYENFKDIVETLKRNDGIKILKEANEISNYLQMSREELKISGERGFEVLKAMRGAVDKILKEFEKREIKC